MISFLKNKYLIFRWRRNLNIRQHVNHVENLFNAINPFEISRQARQSDPQLELTYGEIELESFLALISLCPINESSYFYDLGCGIGKTILCLTHVYPQIQSIGVEKLSPLIEIGMHTTSKEPWHIKNRIHFLNKDLFNISWPQNSIVFINIASFLKDNWQRLNEKCMSMPANIFITCCKPLELSNYSVLETHVQCTWGIRPAYIHQMIDKN